MAAVKACVFCKHCDFEPEAHYSEVTYDSAYFHCKRGHFDGRPPEDIGDGTLYALAQKCPDFQLRDDLIKLES